MPAAGGTTKSEAFSVPRNLQNLALFINATLAGAATLGLEALTPATDVDAGTEDWEVVAVYNLSTPGTSVVTLTNAQAIGCITFPITALAGGPLRWSASADQSGAPQTFHMTFSVTV